MIKKLVALAATALFSLHASAGYVQYDLRAPGLSGYIVQNEQDLSIAYFDFVVGPDMHTIEKHFAPYNGYADIDWALARYNNQGPTRFGIADVDTEGLAYHIWFNFSGTADPHTYRFESRYSFEQIWTPFPWFQLSPVVRYPAGTATRATVDPYLAAHLDAYLKDTNGERYDSRLRRVVPELHVIPEPASIGLLALGAIGLAGATRRRTAVK